MPRSRELVTVEPGEALAQGEVLARGPIGVAGLGAGGRHRLDTALDQVAAAEARDGRVDEVDGEACRENPLLRCCAGRLFFK